MISSKQKERGFDQNQSSFVFKVLIFCLVLVQTTTVVLVIRWSKVSAAEGEGYVTSTAILCGEVVKVAVCVATVWWESRSLIRDGSFWAWFMHPLRISILQDPLDCLKTAVPSVLFAVQNNLLFYALANLQPAVYQIMYQLKILTTAVFMVVLLGRRLSLAQCLWLFGLFCGVAITQLKFDSDEEKTSTLNGFLAILAACGTSGFAGVYLEKVMKGTPPSIFVRNIQLGLFGIAGTCMIIAGQDAQEVASRGFFAGYNTLTCLTVLLHAAGGILIASLIKYADNLMKNIATALAVVLSSIISWLFLDFVLTPYFVVGAIIVLVSAYGYSTAPRPEQA